MGTSLSSQGHAKARGCFCLASDSLDVFAVTAARQSCLDPAVELLPLGLPNLRANSGSFAKALSCRTDVCRMHDTSPQRERRNLNRPISEDAAPGGEDRARAMRSKKHEQETAPQPL